MQGTDLCPGCRKSRLEEYKIIDFTCPTCGYPLIKVVAAQFVEKMQERVAQKWGVPPPGVYCEGCHYLRDCCQCFVPVITDIPDECSYVRTGEDNHDRSM